MEAQMQQKKRLADQMLTEWKDSLWEKENRLFNLEEEITRQGVQSRNVPAVESRNICSSFKFMMHSLLKN